MLTWLRSRLMPGNRIKNATQEETDNQIKAAGLSMARQVTSAVENRGEAQRIFAPTYSEILAKKKLFWNAGFRYPILRLYETCNYGIYRGIPPSKDCKGTEADTGKVDLQRSAPVDLECW